MSQLSIRPAGVSDIPLLLSLINRAGAGLPLEMWKQHASEGETAWESGRKLMMHNHADIYIGNTWIAETGEGGRGAVVLYALPRPNSAPFERHATFMEPLLELEAEASGTAHVSYLSTAAGCRGSGIGSALLRFSESFRGPQGMSIIVARTNDRAHALYERFGYQNLTHRPMVGADGGLTGDEWILMIKPMIGSAVPGQIETAEGGRGMIERSALDRLQEALGDDPADLVDLVETFLADAPSILASMAAGAVDGNLDVVRRQAHSLKSNARDMGATALAGLCAWLEGDIKDGRDPGDLYARVAAIQEEWARVVPALQDEIARLGGGN